MLSPSSGLSSTRKKALCKELFFVDVRTLNKCHFGGFSQRLDLYFVSFSSSRKGWEGASALGRGDFRLLWTTRILKSQQKRESV